MKTENRSVTLAASGIIIALGSASIILPNIFSLIPSLPEPGIGSIIGWICLLAGISYGAYSSASRYGKTTVPKALLAAQCAMTGIYLLLFSSKHPLPISFVISIFLLISSLLRVMYASRIYPQKGTGTVVFFAACDILLAFMASTGYPSAAAWAFGMIFGINLSLHGVTITMTSANRNRRTRLPSLQSS